MSLSGRNINGKSKTLKSGTQDYTNLLFSDSDSDERVPDLKLPPVKGKKQKRKRNLGLRTDDSSCALLSMFKVLLTISILCGILALAAVTFWSLKKITEMEDQIEKLQKSDAATPETITNLQKNLATQDNSITDLKKTSDEMKTKLEGIDKKMEELENTKTALDQKLDTAKEILDLPTKVTALEKTVADIGSDVQQANAKITALEEKINELKDKVTAPIPTPSVTEREQSNVDGQFASMVLDKINVVNQTLTQDLAALKQNVKDQEMALTAFTAAHSSDSELSTSSLNKLISDTVVKIMNNSSVSNEKQKENQTEIDAIMKDVKELSTMKSEHVLFKAAMLSDIKYVNSTLINFSEEFGEIKDHLTLIDNILTNLVGPAQSSQVQSSYTSSQSPNQPYVNEGENATQEETGEHDKMGPESQKQEEGPESQKQEVAPETIQSSLVKSSYTSNQSPTQPSVKEGENGIQGETGEHDKTGSNINGKEDKLVIPGLDNQIAFSNFFKLMSKNGTIEISGFAQGINYTEEKLHTYDTNNDGYFSKDEFEYALGLKPESVKRRKRSEW